MNIDDIAKMTTQERRDWLAIDQGWFAPGDPIPKGPGTSWPQDKPGYLTLDCWYKRIEGIGSRSQSKHPIDDTLDAAAKALPEGWLWSRELMFNGTIHWVIRRWDGDQLRALKLSDTGDEKHARFGLAIAARMAMKKGAHP
jgi:hypothetical protein